jgi:hypothetical protein
MRLAIVSVLSLLGLVLAGVSVDPVCGGPGIARADRLDCPNAVFYWYPDGTFEDFPGFQYQWVAPPDFGSLAEGFPGVSGWVCGIRLELSRSWDLSGEGWIDPYVWEFDPGTGNPGAVLSMITALHVTGVPAIPQTLVLDIQMPESQAGPDGFFVGYWPRSAINGADFGIAVDYDLVGHSRVNYAPGLGYPTGWGTWDVAGYTVYKSMAIGAFVTELPVPVLETSWDAVKSLYR